MHTPNEKMESDQPEIFEPFPEPHTMPSGWDLSEFVDAQSQSSPAPARDETQA